MLVEYKINIHPIRAWPRLPSNPGRCFCLCFLTNCQPINRRVRQNSGIQQRILALEPFTASPVTNTSSEVSRESHNFTPLCEGNHPILLHLPQALHKDETSFHLQPLQPHPLQLNTNSDSTRSHRNYGALPESTTRRAEAMEEGSSLRFLRKTPAKCTRRA